VGQNFVCVSSRANHVKSGDILSILQVAVDVADSKGTQFHLWAGDVLAKWDPADLQPAAEDLPSSIDNILGKRAAHHPV